MTKIIRTPTRAEGGITKEEKTRMDAHAQMWIERALRTDPIEPEKIVPAIEGIYAAAGLKTPRVVIVPSPVVMAAAYGAASAIWQSASATYNAADNATHNATASATRSATVSATDNATRSATDDAFNACFEMAGDLGIKCSRKWYIAYQGGNMWGGLECYLTAMRDIIGLRLPEHDAYHHWEQAAIHGGFRVMHPEFCLVCDFPVHIKMDDNGEPHCEDGPSHLWRDGTSFYFWHGVQVPGRWIEQKNSVDPAEILAAENVEQRAAGISIFGMRRMLDKLDHKIIDSDPDPVHGDLIEVNIPDLPDPVLYLKAHCPRNGTIMEAVNPAEMDERTVKGAQAWRLGIPASEFVYPTIRT